MCIHNKIHSVLSYMFRCLLRHLQGEFLDPLDQAILSHSRLGWSKWYQRLGASCLKTEAEPASETWCFCVYILHNRQSPREDCICMYGVRTQISPSFLCDPRRSHSKREHYTTPPDTAHITRCTWTSFCITQEQGRCLCAYSAQNVNKYGLTLGTTRHCIILK
jgi:hypothetical protein